MDEIRELFAAYIASHPVVETAFWLTALILAAVVVNFVVKVALVRILNRLISGISFINGPDLVKSGVIARLANAAPAMVISSWIDAVPGLPAGIALIVRNVADAFNILVFAMALAALLKLGEKLWQHRANGTGRSVKGYVQIAIIVVYVIAAILMVAAIIDRSPMILLSGLGALTAVLLLVFQDTLLSLVASIQISSTDIVRVGDWIEIPSMNANGTVREMSLYSVTVRNWDNTYTTFPVRKLVSEPFKNWRGMQEAGGRRIQRAIYIDQNTVRFLTDAERAEFSHLRRLTDFIADSTKEIDAWNARLGPAAAIPANRKRMTNVGIFRAYVENYLRDHPAIRQDMLLMVRQLAPGSDGLPLEIYCFTSNTALAEYEATQSDIFDHLLAILPDFGLNVFQAPSGRDFSSLSSDLQADRAAQAPPKT